MIRQTDRDWLVESDAAAFVASLLDCLDRHPGEVAGLVKALPPGAIADPIHGPIVDTIRAAVAAGATPTVGDVDSRLREAGHGVGSEVRIALADALRDYVNTGRRAIDTARGAVERLKRRHADAIARASAERYAASPDSAALADLREAITARDQADSKVTQDLTTDLFGELDAWSRDECDPVIRTGFAPLDSRIDGGLPPGLIGIAGQPGSGKSAMAAQLMLGALLEDRSLTALWCRGEMAAKRLSGRLITAWASIRGDAVPAITLRDARRRSKASRAVAKDKLGIIGHDRLRFLPGPLTVARITETIAMHRPKIVVVDHLGRMYGDGKHDRRAELESIVGQLDEIATSNGITMIVTTPVAKNATVDSAIGTITRDSNRLDFDAECYVSLWVNPSERDKDPREVSMVLNKTRSGHEDRVSLQFTGSGQFFYSTEPHLEEFDEFASFAPVVPR